MGWTVPTYDATRGTGDPAKWATAQFELCRAVNQRQAATAVTKTTFYNAGGALAADRVLGDFDGMRITGTNSYAYLNLTKIRDAIIAMIATGYYTDTAGGTAWTKAALETAIGYDIDAAPSNIQDARFWQAMQDALDALIYVTITITPVQTDATLWTGSIESLIQDAWDNRRTTSNVVQNGGPLWQIAHPSASSDFRASIIEPGSYVFDATAYDGNVVGGLYSITKANGLEIDVDFELSPYNAGVYSETITAETAITSGSLSWLAPEMDLDTTHEVNIAITTAEPATSPCSSLDGAPNFDFAQMRITSGTLYIDLSSVLADQA